MPIVRGQKKKSRAFLASVVTSFLTYRIIAIWGSTMTNQEPQREVTSLLTLPKVLAEERWSQYLQKREKTQLIKMKLRQRNYGRVYKTGRAYGMRPQRKD